MTFGKPIFFFFKTLGSLKQAKESLVSQSETSYSSFKLIYHIHYKQKKAATTNENK